MTKVEVKPALQPCVNQAVSKGVQQWICTGEGMQIQKNAAGQATNEFVAIKPATVYENPGNPELMRRNASSLDSAVQGEYTIQDDYDQWCENGSICTRNPNQYITEVKGNAAYGNQNGAIGSYDAILRVSLNGRQANGRVTVIHDTGPSLFFHSSRFNCAQVGYASCGSHVVNDRVVNSVSRRSQSNLIYGNYLKNNANYYNTFATKFLPTGYQEYTAGNLNTVKFTCSEGGSAQCYY